MFEKGELIMCGGHGVCRVIDITGNPIDRLDQKKTNKQKLKQLLGSWWRTPLIPALGR